MGLESNKIHPGTKRPVSRHYCQAAIKAFPASLNQQFLDAVVDLHRLGFTFHEIVVQSGVDPTFLAAAYSICKIPDTPEEAIRSHEPVTSASHIHASQGSLSSGSVTPMSVPSARTTLVSVPSVVESSAHLTSVPLSSASTSPSLPSAPVVSVPIKAVFSTEYTVVKTYPASATTSASTSAASQPPPKRVKFGANRWSRNMVLELSDDEDDDEEEDDNDSSSNEDHRVHKPTNLHNSNSGPYREMIPGERARLLDAKLAEIERMKRMLREAESRQSQSQPPSASQEPNSNLNLNLNSNSSSASDLETSSDVESLVSFSNSKAVANSSLTLEKKLERLDLIEERLEEKLGETLELHMDNLEHGPGESGPSTTERPEQSSDVPSNDSKAPVLNEQGTTSKDTTDKDMPSPVAFPIDTHIASPSPEPALESDPDPDSHPSAEPYSPPESPVYTGSYNDSSFMHIEKPTVNYFKPYKSPLRVFRSFKFSPLFLDCVGPNGYKSLAYSGQTTEKDVSFCVNLLDGGTCRSPGCKFVHMDDFETSETQMVLNFIDDARLSLKSKSKKSAKADKSVVSSFKKSLVSMLSEGRPFQDIIDTVIEYKRKRDGPTKFLELDVEPSE